MASLQNPNVRPRRRSIRRWLSTHRWQISTVVFALVAACFAALWVQRVDPQLPDITLSDLGLLAGAFTPEWITALTAVTALIVASIAAWATYGQLRTLREESHRRDQDRISQHARAVFYVVQWPIHGADGEVRRPGSLTIYNTGTEPITDVRLMTKRWPGDYAIMPLFSVLLPTGSEGSVIRNFTLAMSMLESTNREAATDDEPKTGASVRMIPKHYLSFTDSMGTQWVKRQTTEMEMRKSGSHSVPYRMASDDAREEHFFTLG